MNNKSQILIIFAKFQDGVIMVFEDFLGVSLYF